MVSGGIASPTDPLESIQFTRARSRAATEEATNAASASPRMFTATRPCHRQRPWACERSSTGSLIEEARHQQGWPPKARSRSDVIAVLLGMTRGQELGLPASRRPRRRGCPRRLPRRVAPARDFGVRMACTAATFSRPRRTPGVRVHPWLLSSVRSIIRSATLVARGGRSGSKARSARSSPVHPLTCWPWTAIPCTT